MNVRNRRSYAVTIDDPDSGESYECAARPGVVEVPDALGKSLLKQEDAWASVDDDEKPAKRGKSDEKGSDQ